MSNTLFVQICDAVQDLFETALDLARRHPSLLDSSIQITTGAEFHHFTPMLVLVLHEIDSLNDIDVVQC